ncbi:MAG TPA: hypothetical protein VGB53_04990 [Rubricoccaceae bacterium]|jgi:hypothetical protein
MPHSDSLYRDDRFDAWTLDRAAIFGSGGGVYLCKDDVRYVIPTSGPFWDGTIAPAPTYPRTRGLGPLRLEAIQTRRFARAGIESVWDEHGDGRGELWLFSGRFGFTNLSRYVEGGIDRLNYIRDDLIVTQGIIATKIDRFEGVWYPGDDEPDEAG